MHTDYNTQHTKHRSIPEIVNTFVYTHPQISYKTRPRTHTHASCQKGSHTQIPPTRLDKQIARKDHTHTHRFLLQDSTSKSPERITHVHTHRSLLQEKRSHTHTQIPLTRLDKQIARKDHTHTHTDPSYKTRQANRQNGSHTHTQIPLTRQIARKNHTHTHTHTHRSLLQDSPSKSPERITHTDPS